MQMITLSISKVNSFLKKILKFLKLCVIVFLKAGENMASFKERLEIAINHSGLSAADLSRLTGINEGAISQYRKGAYKASQPTLEKLAKALNVTIPWLMGVEDVNINHLSALPFPVITEDYVTFPVIGDIAAGYDHIGMEDWEGDVIDIPLSFLKGREKKEFFVLRVKGDSMFPTYQDGDKVLILKQSTLNYSGQVGAILYDGENTSLKKVEFVDGEDWLRMVPINPNHPPKRIEGAELERCRILGIPKVLIRGIEE